MHEPMTYRKALKKAFLSEQDSVRLNVNDQYKSPGNRKGNFNSQAHPKGQRIEPQVVCDFCGKCHDESECRRKLGTCLGCGEGHKYKDFPNKCKRNKSSRKIRCKDLRYMDCAQIDAKETKSEIKIRCKELSDKV